MVSSDRRRAEAPQPRADADANGLAHHVAMRVLILGAGASKPAGYPLAAEVLDEVGRLAVGSPSLQLKDAWDEWVAFRDAMPEHLKLIANNSNPEVVLTWPDLYSLAVENEDDQRQSDAIRTYMATGESKVSELEKYFDSTEREALASAARPRSRLLHALEWYFLYKHHEDRDVRSRRDYFRPLTEDLEEGDLNHHVELGHGSRANVGGGGAVEPYRRIRLQTEPCCLRA